jgi:Pyridoxamine 5'-phosphate oxidase
MTEFPRSLEQRKSDSLHRLEADKDLWIASCDSAGHPYLVPISFWWSGTHIFVATITTNPTGQNILETGRVRIALGHTRDVVLIDASAKLLSADEVKPEYGDAYAAKLAWDPRESKAYKFFEFEPLRVEAWRTLDEIAGRELMRDGKWLV